MTRSKREEEERGERRSFSSSSSEEARPALVLPPSPSSSACWRSLERARPLHLQQNAAAFAAAAALAEGAGAAFFCRRPEREEERRRGRGRGRGFLRAPLPKVVPSTFDVEGMRTSPRRFLSPRFCSRSTPTPKLIEKHGSEREKKASIDEVSFLAGRAKEDEDSPRADVAMPQHAL